MSLATYSITILVLLKYLQRTKRPSFHLVSKFTDLKNMFENNRELVEDGSFKIIEIGTQT